MATGDAGLRVEEIKTEWLGRLEALVNDVKHWAERDGWKTRRITKPFSERELGEYRVPVLLMEKDAVEVVLNPVARRVPDAEGAVDLYLAPAYDDIASLYYEPAQGGWVVQYGGRPNQLETHSAVEIKPYPFNEETIRSILDGMAASHA